MFAWLNLRHGVPERTEAVHRGLKRHGFKIADGEPNRPGDRDIFLTWNRIRGGDATAKKFERRGLAVLVMENATWGNDFAGRQWYHMARTYHNTAGRFPIGNRKRWDSLNQQLQPMRRAGGETVILAQRGIGSPPTAMPMQWPQQALERYGGRIRAHPGRGARNSVPLHDDLIQCSRVVTWGSGSAVKALMMGIPVVSEMPDWIGAQDNTEPDRLRMFQELAWAQWTLPEIASGETFERLLYA